MRKFKKTTLTDTEENELRKKVQSLFRDPARLRYIVENRLKVFEYRVSKESGFVNEFQVIDDNGNIVARGSTYREAIDCAMKGHDA